MSLDEAEGPLEEWCHSLLRRNPTGCQQASLKVRVQWTVGTAAPLQQLVSKVAFALRSAQPFARNWLLGRFNERAEAVTGYCVTFKGKHKSLN